MPRLLDLETGTIPNNLYANEMRVSMENKNLLSKRGSIYVGMGTENSVPVPDGTPGTTGGQSKSAKTVALERGADGQILTAIPQATSGNPNCGLGWKNLRDLQDYKTLQNDFNSAIKEVEDTLDTLTGDIGNITVKGTSLQLNNSTDWESGGTGAPGTYKHVITPDVHKLGATSNISVQLMVPNGSSAWTIVSTTIDVNNDGTITIYSNIQTAAKVVMITF